MKVVNVIQVMAIAIIVALAVTGQTGSLLAGIGGLVAAMLVGFILIEKHKLCSLTSK